MAIARVALPGMHGNVGAQLNNLVALHLTVSSSGGSVTWEGSTSVPALLAWIVGPPVVLALTARWARELEADEEVAGSPAISGGETTRVLGTPRPDWEAGDRGADVEAERRRLRESP